MAFLDTVPSTRGTTQYSVLIRGRDRSQGHVGAVQGPGGVLAIQLPPVEEVYRVRLPQNR